MDKLNMTSGETIMSLQIGKTFRPSALMAAVLLIDTCTAVAADAGGDLQQQMRELLAGRITTTQSAQPSERREDRTVRRTADVQELERRLLLGATDSRAQGTQAMTRPDGAAGMSTVKKDLLVHDDAQASARRLLLGR
jgi:hypothetical protein